MEPSGETCAQRGMRTVNASGATSTGKRSAGRIFFSARTRTGIAVTSRLATSTRQKPPPVQKTIDPESGVQAMAGALP